MIGSFPYPEPVQDFAKRIPGIIKGAAALCVAAGSHVRAVSISETQTALVRNGAYLGEIRAATTNS